MITKIKNKSWESVSEATIELFNKYSKIQEKDNKLW